MFHLDARVDLDEVPRAGVGVHQELDRAGVVVAGGSGQGDGGIGQGGAGAGIEGDGGSDLDHFLMAALDRAIALVEMQDVAVPVAQDLDFDVAGAADEALQEDGAVAEGRLGFAAGFLQPAGEIGGVFHHAHAPAAAAERGLDDEGEADFTGDLLRVPGIVHRLLGAGDHGDAGLLGKAAGGGLIAEQVEKVGAGADEGDAGLGAGAREGGIFGEEAVARMDGIHFLFPGQGDDALVIEVGLHRPFALADEVGFVGLEAVQGQAVFLGIDGNRAQAEFVGRAQNANGDFAAVQREKLLHDVNSRLVGLLSD